MNKNLMKTMVLALFLILGGCGGGSTDTASQPSTSTSWDVVTVATADILPIYNDPITSETKHITIPLGPWRFPTTRETRKYYHPLPDISKILNVTCTFVNDDVNKVDVISQDRNSTAGSILIAPTELTINLSSYLANVTTAKQYNDPFVNRGYINITYFD